jgi:integrase
MTDPATLHLEHLAQARYSAATLDARRRLLATLPDPLNVDRERMEQWWQSRQTTGRGEIRAASSLSGEQSHLRAFYRWAQRRDLIDHNPADWLDTIRQTSTMANPVREGDLYRAMREAPPDMRRMLALGSMAGLRSAEIARITWADIDRDAGVLWVRQGKGGKDRSVPLSTGLLVELGDPGEGLIIGKTLTPKAVSLTIGRYLQKCGINSTAHKLRARYASRFVAATGDLAATARVMGHSSVATTQRYVVASSDTMRKGAEACGRIG